MQLNVKNETSTLKAVVLGQPGSIGKVPTLEETYDAKSYESVLHNIYPIFQQYAFKASHLFENIFFMGYRSIARGHWRIVIRCLPVMWGL